MKLFSAIYRMKGNFARISNIIYIMSQYNSVGSVLKKRPKFFLYSRFLKKCLVNDFIIASYMLLHTNIIGKKSNYVIRLFET